MTVMTMQQARTLIDQLYASTNYLIEDRAEFYRGCSIESGDVPDPDDREYLDRLDALILKNMNILEELK